MKPRIPKFYRRLRRTDCELGTEFIKTLLPNYKLQFSSSKSIARVRVRRKNRTVCIFELEPIRQNSLLNLILEALTPIKSELIHSSHIATANALRRLNGH